MLKMVDGTGIIGVDMICPLGVYTPQPPNYDRVELEGTGMLVLPNSLDAPLERLELGGKTEQVQTSGKNLFDFSKLETGRINISTGTLEEHNHTRRLADYIDITGITSFSVYLPGYNKANGAVYVVIYYYDKDKKYLSYRACGDKQEKYENIAPVENAVYIKVTLEQNTIDNPQNIFKVQLEKGAKSTDYEPYTGGKPSPSPEYPQEIKSVGKWNEEKYEIGVKLTGKNLFDKGSAKKGYEFSSVTSDMESPKEGWFVSDFIPVIGKVYISGKSTGSGCKLYNKDKVFVENIQAPSGALTIKEGISYFRLNGEIKDLDNVQVEYGSVATSYEPYKKPQSLALTSDRPITKWDKLVEQGGQIGWLYGTEKYVVTGKENFSYGSENYYTGSRVDMFFEIGDATGNEAIMRDLSFVTSIWHLTDKEGFCINGKQLHIGLYNTRIGVSGGAAKEEKIKAYKEFMAKRYADGNPFEVYYKTTETEFVPLPQSEQDAIRALKTYYPTTVITADGGELYPDIKVTYRKEI